MLTIVHNLANAICLFVFFAGNDTLAQIHYSLFDRLLHFEFAICLIVAVVFNVIASLFVGHLIVFHLVLQRKGMTTFDYIRWKEDRKRASRIVVKVPKEESGASSETSTNNQLAEMGVVGKLPS